MSNVLLAYNNVVDGGTLSGGAWLPSLPLTNAQNARVGIVARSVDTNPNNTQFLLDLGTSQKISVAALVNHNFSLSASYRIQAFADTDPGLTAAVADTGVQSVWPVIYPTANLEWEDSNYWAGTPSQSDIQGYQASVIAVFPAQVAARYLMVNIYDQGNTAGFVQFGRLFAGKSWQPIVNMDYGASLGWEASTGVVTAISGGEFYDHRTPYRVAKFSTTWLSQDEAYGFAFDILRQLGVDGECIYMYDPSDTIYALRRQFYGRLRTLSPIQAPMLNLNSVAWEVKERI